jgi:hypothetical protein
MKRRHGALLFFAVSLSFLMSCAGGLPPSLQREVSDEKYNLVSTEQAVQHSQSVLKQDLAQAPDLFQGAAEPAQWAADITSANNKLASAKRDFETLARSTDANQVRRLLAQERSLREAAVATAKATDASAAKWLTFRQNLPASLEAMNREYTTIHSSDFAPIAKTVAQTEKDWPAKTTYLDGRLANLRTLPHTADTEWASISTARQDAAAGKAAGKQVAALLETDQLLSEQAKTISAAPTELTSLCAQLYNTWDRILTDLDETHYGGDSVFRERVKEVTTHYTDVAAKKTETHSDEHWTNVSEGSFRAVQNDMGMAISHKDAGHFDSEAQTVPQPPGYTYIAPPEVGSNQYGYWSHDPYGHSVWAWLPQYLILRELLWNHSYQPVVVSDYSAFRTAQRSGTSYYGQRTPDAPPKYGSHGTFTQSHYANSRYVQSGAYRGSAYASAGSSPSRPSASRSWGSGEEGSAGKRFGRQPGSPGLGQRFGRPSGGGFRPSGRGFGRRR